MHLLLLAPVESRRVLSGNIPGVYFEIALESIHMKINTSVDLEALPRLVEEGECLGGCNGVNRLGKPLRYAVVNCRWTKENDREYT